MMAAPEASVARPLASTVFSFADAIASERIRGYRLATPSPVRNSAPSPTRGLRLCQKARNAAPATRMVAKTSR